MSLFSYEVDVNGTPTYKDSFTIGGNEIGTQSNIACDENFVYFIDDPDFYHNEGTLRVLSVDENGLPTQVYELSSMWNICYKVFRLGDFLYTSNYLQHPTYREGRLYRYSISVEGVLTLLDYVETGFVVNDMSIDDEGVIYTALDGAASFT